MTRLVLLSIHQSIMVVLQSCSAFFFVSVSLERRKFEGMKEFIFQKIQTYALFRSVRLPICMCNFRCRRLELRLDLSWEKTTLYSRGKTQKGESQQQKLQNKKRLSIDKIGEVIWIKSRSYDNFFQQRLMALEQLNHFSLHYD